MFSCTHKRKQKQFSPSANLSIAVRPQAFNCLTLSWHWNGLTHYFSITVARVPQQTTLLFNFTTRMWLISSHNLLRLSKLHYKQGQSTFWNNKILIIIFNPHSRCYTTRQIAMFIYFPSLLLQINRFGFLSQCRELTLHPHPTPSPAPPLKPVLLSWSVCFRDCHALDRGDNLTFTPQCTWVRFISVWPQDWSLWEQLAFTKRSGMVSNNGFSPRQLNAC